MSTGMEDAKFGNVQFNNPDTCLNVEMVITEILKGHFKDWYSLDI